MKRFVAILCLLGLLQYGTAQDYQHVSDYGFRLASNVTASTWTFTNDNAYPWRIYTLSLNTDAAVTTTVTLIRPHSIDKQVVGNVVTTNDMGGIETNYYYTVTNTVQSYTTNLLFSVTNTDGLYDEDDFQKVYVWYGDVLKLDFGETNTVQVLIDAVR